MNKYRILPKVDGFTRVQVVAAIRSILVMDRPTRIDCLNQMIDLHTKREKKTLTAIEDDNKGFNKVDLPRMFMIHSKIKNNTFTNKDDAFLRDHLPHYAEQYITLLGTKKTTLIVNTYYKE